MTIRGDAVTELNLASGFEAPALLGRIARAINDHDLDGLTDAFRQDVDSRQPVHPHRDFQGADQIRTNWTAIFEGIPDISAHLIRSATNGHTVWAEWEWRGTRGDGQPHHMRGVTILGERDGRAAWVRFFMEPVDRAGDDIDGVIGHMTSSAGGSR